MGARHAHERRADPQGRIAFTMRWESQATRLPEMSRAAYGCSRSRESLCCRHRMTRCGRRSERRCVLCAGAAWGGSRSRTGRRR